MKKEYKINGEFGRDITFDITTNDSKEPLPVILFLHGFKGFKDWGAWHLVADYFANEGYAFVKMNFSHNGVDPDDLSDLSDPDAFADNNFFIELSDVSKVLDWVIKRPTLSDDITLIGHSRAGGISLISAKEQARVSRVVTWAAVSNYHRYIGRWDIDKWKEEGYLEFVNSRTKQVMNIDYQFYEVLNTNESFFDLELVAKSIQQPALIVHARNDEAVDYQQAEELDSWIQHSQLLLLDTGGHVFDTKHPYDDSELPANMKQVCVTVDQFIRKENKG